MQPSLTDFQDLFVEALYNPEADTLTLLTDQPGFSVYRNTVMKGAVDALLANFPTVERLVGREWFLAAAAIHARHAPPEDARLVYHGSGFPEFLDRFEHAQQMPYLGNVARLDLLWNQCHTAMEEPGVDVTRLASLAPEDLATLVLKPRRAAQWLWFAGQPVFTIWRHNREQTPIPDDLAWRGEGALLVRSGGVVTWHPLTVGECAFLDACKAGAPLEHAAQQATEVEPSLDMLDLLTRLVGADAFAANEPA